MYVGKSKELKKRVLSHFAADHAAAREMSLAQQVRRIECIETGGEIGALLKEAALIKQLQPMHNRTLRRNDELCFWQLVEERAGEWRPLLLRASDLGAAPQRASQRENIIPHQEYANAPMKSGICQRAHEFR